MANIKDIKAADKNQETVYGDIGSDITALVGQSTVRKLTAWENNLQQTHHNDDLIVIPEQELAEILTVIKLAEAEDDAATAKKRKQFYPVKQISTLTAAAGRRLREPVVSFCDIKNRLRKINRCMDKLVFPKVSPARKQKMRVKKNKIRKANLRTEKNDLYDCPLCQDERISLDTNEYTLPCLIH